MRLHPRSIDLELERVQRLLAALGSPERKLPPIVHVAGTMKNAVPAVIGRQREVSTQVIAAAAAKLAAPLFRLGREWQMTPTEKGFRYESDQLGLDLPAPALVGAHQLDNAATAVACIERLRTAQFRIDDRAIGKGLLSVDWPARLQKLTRGPLAGSLPPG